MSEFKIVEIINANTIRVAPAWQFPLNKESNFVGDRIFIRGLDVNKNNSEAKQRLEKILLNTKSDIILNSPELIEYNDVNNAVVSCSVYLGETNIVYYFPEYALKQ